VISAPSTARSSDIIDSENRYVAIVKTLLVISIYINITKVLLGSRFFTLIADGFTLCFAVYFLYQSWSHRKKLHSIEKWVLAFLFLGLAEIFHPNIPGVAVGMEGYRRLAFQMLGVLIGFRVITDRRTLVSVVKFVVIISVPVLLYAVKQFFNMSAFDEKLMESNTADVLTYSIFDRIRAFSIFNGPFHLGIFGGFIFWLSFFVYRETGKKILLWVSVLAALSVLVSLTRSSIIALAGSGIVIFIIFVKKDKVVILSSILAVILALYVILRSYSSEFEDMNQVLETISDWENVSSDHRLESRFDVYDIGVDIVTSAPFGYGMGSGGDAMESYFEPGNRFHMTTHNMFLKAAVETGWFGLAIYLYLFILFGRNIWALFKRDAHSAILFAGMLLIILITGITGSTMEAYPMNLIFWIFMGALTSMSDKVTESQRK
jgi:O-antigen ligase